MLDQKLKPTLNYQRQHETLKQPCLPRVKRLQAVPLVSLCSRIALVTCSYYQKEKKQIAEVNFHVSSFSNGNSHLCISSNLTHRQMSPPEILYVSAGRFLEEKREMKKKTLHTGRSKLHSSCFLKGTKYDASFQARSSRLKSAFSC